jgi:hypothetical protein
MVAVGALMTPGDPGLSSPLRVRMCFGIGPLPPVEIELSS